MRCADPEAAIDLARAFEEMGARFEAVSYAARALSRALTRDDARRTRVALDILLEQEPMSMRMHLWAMLRNEGG